MIIEKLIAHFKETILTVTADNQFVVFDSLESEIRLYHEKGGIGKGLYEFLWAEYPKFDDNEEKQNIVGDIMNKISGHCPNNQMITFNDIDFDLFNRESGKFTS